MASIQIESVVDENGGIILNNLPFKKGQKIKVLVEETKTKYKIKKQEKAGTIWEIVGVWKDREDITDSIEYAKELRNSPNHTPDKGTQMLDTKTYIAILESIKDPVAFVDANHIIQYLNKAAVERYAKFGGASLIGASLFGCHNENSKRIILEIFESFQNGEQEKFYGVVRGQRAFMRAVRDENQQVIGYFERYEDIV